MEHSSSGDLQTTRAIVIGIDAAVLQLLAALMDFESVNFGRSDFAEIIETLSTVRAYYANQVESGKI